MKGIEEFKFFSRGKGRNGFKTKRKYYFEVDHAVYSPQRNRMLISIAVVDWEKRLKTFFIKSYDITSPEFYELSGKPLRVTEDAASTEISAKNYIGRWFVAEIFFQNDVPYIDWTTVEH